MSFWTQVINQTYKSVKETSRTFSYVRLIYVLCPRGSYLKYSGLIYLILNDWSLKQFVHFFMVDINRFFFEKLFYFLHFWKTVRKTSHSRNIPLEVLLSRETFFLRIVFILFLLNFRSPSSIYDEASPKISKRLKSHQLLSQKNTTTNVWHHHQSLTEF